jgi:hypothetical protein
MKELITHLVKTTLWLMLYIYNNILFLFALHTARLQHTDFLLSMVKNGLVAFLQQFFDQVEMKPQTKRNRTQGLRKKYTTYCRIF